MKSYIVCLAFLAGMFCSLTCFAAEQEKLKDGVYFGYKYLPNLSPGDPDAEWYYECDLFVKGGHIKLAKFPRTKIKGEVFASASDGAFPVYEGLVEADEKRTIVSLRKISCDYCMIEKDDPLPSKIVREYVLRFISADSFELDNVTYTTNPDPELTAYDTEEDMKFVLEEFKKFKP